MQRDRDGALPVAIVSRTMARRYWNGEDPIGRRLRIGRDPAWLTVVGVVDDVQHTWFDEPSEPTFYVPLPQSGTDEWRCALRGAGDAASLAQRGTRRGVEHRSRSAGLRRGDDAPGARGAARWACGLPRASWAGSGWSAWCSPPSACTA